VRTVVLRQGRSPVTTVGPQGVLTARADCLPGERVVAGSGSTNDSPLMLNQMTPLPGDAGWLVTFANRSTNTVPGAQVIAYATCVTP
jgi:hypothetical protein